jgi:hypothetical protein
MGWINKILDWTKRTFKRTTDKVVEIKESTIKEITKKLNLEQFIVGTFNFNGEKVELSQAHFYEIVSLKHKDEEEYVRMIAYNDPFIPDRLLILGQVVANGVNRITPIILVFTDRLHQYEIKKESGQGWLLRVDQTHLSMEFNEKTLWNLKKTSKNSSIDVVSV